MTLQEDIGADCFDAIAHKLTTFESLEDRADRLAVKIMKHIKHHQQLPQSTIKSDTRDIQAAGYTKDWCINMAARENGGDISAGIPLEMRLSAGELIEKFDKYITGIPLGIEDKQLGKSKYNWGKYYAGVLLAIYMEPRK